MDLIKNEMEAMKTEKKKKNPSGKCSPRCLLTKAGLDKLYVQGST